MEYGHHSSVTPFSGSPSLPARYFSSAFEMLKSGAIFGMTVGLTVGAPYILAGATLGVGWKGISLYKHRISISQESVEPSVTLNPKPKPKSKPTPTQKRKAKRRKQESELAGWATLRAGEIEGKMLTNTALQLGRMDKPEELSGSKTGGDQSAGSSELHNVSINQPENNVQPSRSKRRLPKIVIRAIKAEQLIQKATSDSDVKLAKDAMAAVKTKVRKIEKKLELEAKAHAKSLAQAKAEGKAEAKAEMKALRALRAGKVQDKAPVNESTESATEQFVAETDQVDVSAKQLDTPVKAGRWNFRPLTFISRLFWGR